ncbi:MAG: TonB-dependent receptor [Paludibacteraceae bacterium]|nr:TonB-dependent receptor [Paludibacteraceae bacterium]MBN2788333.1 TonB-dependent receptor [Paludibacteraceae bacterium]
MNKKFTTVLLTMLVFACTSAQQTGVIIGSVKDKNTQAEIIGASILVEGTNLGTITDINGNYKLTAPVGTYTIRVSSVGYVSATKYNILLMSGYDQLLNFELVEDNVSLNDVVVTFDKEKSASAGDMISPLSVQQLTSQEIRSNPGGSLDVSKVVQTLPGVGSNNGGGGSRNDIIIRGGAPNENVYYLDGIEVPIINHFQTQGSSGGAQGILNVAFIEDLKLTSSAFDARYDNVLASTFVINQRNGNPERLEAEVRTGLTESALTFEGPIGKNKKTTFLASARQSYLGLLFSWIDIPIRPNYFDYQYKITHQFNNKNSLTVLGIGAIDNFSFAQNANSTPENVYITRSLPYINQWNYTIGTTYKHLYKKGFMTVSFSRNLFENNVDKYKEGVKDETAQTLDLKSTETENKLKIDFNSFVNGWKFSGGVGAQYVKYNIGLFSQITNDIVDGNGTILLPGLSINTNNNIEFFKYGAYAQIAKVFFNKRLLISGGVRSDMNTFTETGNNPLKTLSPRLSLQYKITPKFDITASLGQYYKIPTYTALGYKDNNGVLVNKDMEYIQSTHYVLGTEYLPNDALRFVVEGFYKQYANYPVSLATGVSLANLGNDFGAIGNERVVSNGLGKALGMEFSVQQKLIKKLFYVISYTYVESYFAGLDGVYRPSTWDNRHLLSTTLGYIFKNNYQAGLKYRYAGGNPYTPFNMPVSQQSYLLLGTGTLNYAQTNSLRLLDFSQLDIRIDKKFNFKKSTLEVFIDVQNILGALNESSPTYTFKRNADNTGFETSDGLALKQDGSNAIPLVIYNKTRTVIPTIGLMFMF